jgi:hypothetical protein
MAENSVMTRAGCGASFRSTNSAMVSAMPLRCSDRNRLSSINTVRLDEKNAPVPRVAKKTPGGIIGKAEGIRADDAVEKFSATGALHLEGDTFRMGTKILKKGFDMRQHGDKPGQLRLQACHIQIELRTPVIEAIPLQPAFHRLEFRHEPVLCRLDIHLLLFGIASRDKIQQKLLSKVRSRTVLSMSRNTLSMFCQLTKG